MKSMTGNVFFDGKTYDLSCNFSDDTILVCVAGDGLRQYVGRAVHGQVYGFSFETTIPSFTHFANYISD
jgi:hypothetical protein